MGKLVQVDTFTISSPVASIIIGGGSSGSSGLNASIDTNDVYMVAINNVVPTNDNYFMYWRVTVSGTPDTSSNYDRATKLLRADTTFTNLSEVNAGAGYAEGTQLGTSTGEAFNGIWYLYNWNNSSEYSFLTQENSMFMWNAVLMGSQGGAVHTVAQSCDGIQFVMQSGNIASGTFTLYKVL